MNEVLEFDEFNTSIAAHSIKHPQTHTHHHGPFNHPATTANKLNSLHNRLILCQQKGDEGDVGIGGRIGIFVFCTKA